MACAVVHLRRERDDEKRTARNNYCSSMRDRGEGGEEGRSFLVDGWAKGAKEQKRERYIYFRGKVIVVAVHGMEEERIKEARSRRKS